jgi:hypothetical protein
MRGTSEAVLSARGGLSAAVTEALVTIAPAAPA